MYIIETKQLKKDFKYAHALQGIDLALSPGHIYGLVGTKSAGKTTLFRILAGLAHPTGGSFSLFGETTRQGQNKARKKIGFLIDEPAYYPNMSGRANLHNVQLSLGFGDKAELTRVLELVGLNPNSRQRLNTYSMSMKQRYGLAAALIGDPELLILDEPFNGLDPDGVRDINNLLCSLRAQGKTILMSSHLLAQLYKTATDFIFMDHGKIIRQVSLEELQSSCDYCMTVRTSEPERAAELLRHHLSAVEDIETGDGCLILAHCTEPAGSIQRVMQIGNLEVSVEISGVSLEDYFTNLIAQHNS